MRIQLWRKTSEKTIVFVFGLLLGAAVILILHTRSAKAGSDPYVSRFRDVSSTADQHNDVVRPSLASAARRHFFNSACQFSTTVKGEAPRVPVGAGIRNRLPSGETSQNNTPVGTLKSILGTPD